MTLWIVNVSGGLTSYEALRRTIAKHGLENTRAVFADTTIEDEDLYKFLDDQETAFGIKITRVCDGRTPWQVMKDKRYITLQGMAPCSNDLKRKMADSWTRENFPDGDIVRVFGYEWSELERMERLKDSLAPMPVWFPLSEPPYADKCHIAAQLERDGIHVPRLYTLGFEHNNCGGACVKAGQAHWAHLLRVLPEVYAIAELEEEGVRQHIGKDISILKDRAGGPYRRPLTLRAFRERVQSGEAYDKDDWGGCGCFAPTHNLRMEDMLLEAK